MATDDPEYRGRSLSPDEKAGQVFGKAVRHHGSSLLYFGRQGRENHLPDDRVHGMREDEGVVAGGAGGFMI